MILHVTPVLGVAAVVTGPYGLQGGSNPQIGALERKGPPTLRYHLHLSRLAWWASTWARSFGAPRRPGELLAA